MEINRYSTPKFDSTPAAINNVHSSTEFKDDGSPSFDDSAFGKLSEELIKPPELVHQLRTDSSVLALAVSQKEIFAGTQDGEILVWSLASFELIQRIEAHTRSILCLSLSNDENMIFSCAGDAIVNVWCPKTFKLMYHIYSTYDLGDVFCVVYSAQFQMVYLGSQNTSIQWCSLKDTDIQIPPNPENHPDRRNHHFFDSVAGGGTSTPRSPSNRGEIESGTLIEIDKSQIIHYAHYGFVYCMLIASGITRLMRSSDDILISGGGDGTIKLWGLSDTKDQQIKEIACLGVDNGESVLSMALDGSFLYSSKLDGMIELWDLDTQQKVRVIKAHDAHILTLQMKWGFIFCASSTGFARKFSTARNSELCTTSSVYRKEHIHDYWRAHSGRVITSALIEYNGQRLYITGSSDKTISTWEIVGLASDAEEEIKTHAENLLIKSLREFVSFKTISSSNNHAEDCRRGATFLRKLFQKNGATTEMLNTENQWNPVVYAKFSGNPSTSSKRKRILFYGHYDVVSANNQQNNWITDPFKMKGVDGYLYGRGVSDNKGPILAALFAVVDLIQEKKLESDIIFLIEGEEESGSRGFKNVVRKYRSLIGNIDYILIANSYWIDDEIPCLTYGLRGVLHATILVDSDHRDVHSGVDGSFMTDEPLFDLTSILAKLKGKENRVAIPGFYDSILPLTPAESARFDDIVEILIRRKPEIGERDKLKNSLMARWREPNLTIHRYKVSGPEGSLVSSHASAAISLRLVPAQEVEDVIKSLVSFLTSAFKELGSKNNLSINIENHADAWLGDPDNAIYHTLEKAVMDAWGPIGETESSSVPGPDSKIVAKNADSSNSTLLSHQHSEAKTLDNTDTSKIFVEPYIDSNNGNKKKGRRPLYIREGGSIPSIRILEKEFDAPAAHLPCGQASDSAHLENERFRVQNLYKSRDIFRQVFKELPLR
ncbi:putative di- and tripeptidase DUG2 [Golovinomyces cichoracearum]|uniref:Putative di-and tripeptidase DUG2 n=1 Tax=Golovinomyces cichoracearum TaxID=62708 RepID=A0A420IUC5_9PEZI|nr:putative di- and tripeptidase DUG2 [Golovinomyces cichoracearum]